jgi:hypothetical protein
MLYIIHTIYLVPPIFVFVVFSTGVSSILFWLWFTYCCFLLLLKNLHLPLLFQSLFVGFEGFSVIDWNEIFAVNQCESVELQPNISETVSPLSLLMWWVRWLPIITVLTSQSCYSLYQPCSCRQKYVWNCGL